MSPATSNTCHHRITSYLSALYLVVVLLLKCHKVAGILGKSQMCEVETGQTNIILDIEESRGDCKYLFLFIILF